MSSTLAISAATPSSSSSSSSSSLYLQSSPPPSPPISKEPSSSIHINHSTDDDTDYNMRFLPPQPPSSSPSSRKHTSKKYTQHRRRRDCYQRLQIIIQENERIEREEHEAMLRKAPNVIARRSPSQEKPSILVKTPAITTPPESPTTPSSPITPTNNEFLKSSTPSSQPPRQSVRFAPDPPKVFHCSTSTSPITKLRNFLHLFSD
ncbi:hypothetical protein O0I10_003792 [Lichtheimia ornata]|uniref:Uncharacterized protein n=1 Tax=Lichtheimia ornata TaxID=688661 RepID=A0AAD7XZM7_9FUNG|nr:uncharacterized protein O0I10_003792 [Lichtheimia ornata]KAJ8660335.1 hypothetical protein O0I10_003792 [Lichtheimia ornata]